MESNLSKKSLLRKVFTQRKDNLNSFIDTSLNLRRSIAKDESLSHISMDYRKGRSKIKKILILDSTLQEKRKEIYKSSTLKNKIAMCYKLILKNRKELIYLSEDNKLGNPANDVESFKYHINYFYNYLLLFCLLYNNKDIKNARVTLNHLNNEMKERLVFLDFSLFHLQKYNILILEYIKFLSSYLSCIYKLGTDYNYEEILIKYLEIIEAIPDNKLILSYLYFYSGQLMIEMNYLGLGIKCYEYANFNSNEFALKLKAYKLIVSILYNKSLLEFVFYDEKSIHRNNCIETLIEAKNTKLKEIEVYSPKNTRGSHNASISQFRRNSIKMIGEIIPKKDHQLLDIYLLLFEFDYKNKSYETIDDYITFIEANSRHLSSEMISKAKFILKKIAELNDNKIDDNNSKGKLNRKGTKKYNQFLSDNKSEKDINASSMSLYHNKHASNEEDFINFCLPQRKSPSFNQNEIIEFEKFFLFLTKLSAYQIELLNLEQPDKKNYKKFKSLPIYFSTNFKQSLNLEQMKLLNNIKILMLKRKLVLKNVDHLIMVDNLNYELIYKYEDCSVPIIPLNNLHSIKKRQLEFHEFKKEMRRNSIPKKEKRNSIKAEIIIEDNNQLKFKYQDRIPYESLKANLKKKYKSNICHYPMDEIIKDGFIIELLNRMKYKEVKMLNDNPEWLLEILVDYKKKIEKEERCSGRTKEDKDKKEEKVVEQESERDESSISDKAEVEQKKSNDFLDAMKIGKDE
jgi:hypothetical protein